jgi:hypothetical protein
MREHPPVAARKWTTQGGHWCPPSDLLSTQPVIQISTTKPKQWITPELNIRRKRERGLRGLIRRLRGAR